VNPTERFWLGFLVFSSGTLVTVVNCGGKAGVDSQSPQTGNSGGYLGVGGGVGVGGFAGGNASTLVGTAAAGSSTILGTRVPAIHRGQALSCIGVHSPPEPNIMYPEYSSCLKHADCTQGVNGKCIVGIGMESSTGYCAYDLCATDADCDPGKVCHCTPSSAARCLTIGNCQVDGDCGTGRYCSPAAGWDCGGYHTVDSYYCHTAADTCLDDSDCADTSYCNFDVYDGRWKCTQPNYDCVIG